MQPSMSAPTDLDPVLVELVDQITQLVESGKAAEVDALLAKHPEHEQRLRNLLPAILGMANFSLASGVAGLPAGLGNGNRLGDFVLVGAVGRGGMGIVYEALQTSLGRRVALKILPADQCSEQMLDRFRRETQAAARLHHPNIVPVFGSGEHAGLHFYAMQFVAGQGLDVLIKRLRSEDPSFAGRASGGETPSLPVGLTDTSANAHAKKSTVREGPLLLSPVELEKPRTPAYYRAVAKVGLQIAQGLDYAHGQGVLHRDIKPSNLLLDEQGTVWITDFGLAKIEGENALTQTGDVVGTLRFMAPERFKGHGDARGDVYSLGVTLYELLTLRPAFDEADRARLIDRIASENPPKPRDIDANIPADLEMILCKAMDKEPHSRYATAADLADDLQRFLSDRPIHARPMRWWDALRKWARRKPAAAALAATILVAAAALLSLGGFSYWQVSSALEDTEAANQDLDKAVKVREEALGERTKALGERTDALNVALADKYRALLSETRALRMSGEVGWRARAIANLKTLAAMDTPAKDRVELRTEAVACFTHVDLERVGVAHATQVTGFAVSPDGETLATIDNRGVLRYWEMATFKEPRIERTNLIAPYLGDLVLFHPRGDWLAHATNEGVVFKAWKKKEAPAPLPGGTPRRMALSADGGKMAMAYANGRLVLHDVATGQQEGAWAMPKSALMPFALSPAADSFAVAAPGGKAVRLIHVSGRPGVEMKLNGTLNTLAFSSDGARLAASDASGTVHVWRVSGELLQMLPAGNRDIFPNMPFNGPGLAFSPRGSWLALAHGELSLRDVRTGQEVLRSMPSDGVLHTMLPEFLHVAFHADGRYLTAFAPRLGSYNLAVFRVHAHEHLRLTGHEKRVMSIAFHPRDQLMASYAQGERQVLLRDETTGRLVRRIDGTAAAMPLRFTDGDLLWCQGMLGQELQLRAWECKTGILRRQFPFSVPSIMFAAWDEAAGRLVLNGKSYWDLNAEKEIPPLVVLKDARADYVRTVHFLKDEKKLLAVSGFKTTLVDLATGKAMREVEMNSNGDSAVSPDQKIVAITGLDRTATYSLPDLDPLGKLGEREFIGPEAFSPDGHCLASHLGGRVMLRDPATLKLLCALPTYHAVVTRAAFSPRGRLAVWGQSDTPWLLDLASLRNELEGIGLNW